MNKSKINDILIYSQFSLTDIEKIETKYNAQYVCDSCLKNKFGGWADLPVSVFYTEESHPQGSNYFGIFRSPFDSSLVIADAIKATEPFTGLKCGDGTIIYSRFAHDYVKYGKYFIDGGREYTRRSIDGETVTLQIQKNNLKII